MQLPVIQNIPYNIAFCSKRQQLRVPGILRQAKAQPRLGILQIVLNADSLRYIRGKLHHLRRIDHHQSAAYCHAGGYDLRVVEVESGKTSRINLGDRVYAVAVWSPDGQHLYFASNRSGSMNLWRVPIDEASGLISLGHLAVAADGGEDSALSA